ncbi:unnamed protein product [Adineta steineri]|uniref:Uncharacterized protein n=1 Tax=Adineta steineri TaxID=433720 RepID=A0A818QNT0_9BILA|nr:unnamed protein product [Adineta steineri]CAF1275789.1 unnamed protein product [Adineta steineri]CAF1283753.1 unnamed protein product [Adineta steineri]CAF3541037.1 unnamed protein product [Adineta steineri]CAF3643460.1 unnamed protein product [Adineta steineri]
MSYEESAHFKTIAHTDTSMSNERLTFGMKFSQFLSKLCWQFDQLPAPNYSHVNQKHLTSSNKTTKKHGGQSFYQISPFDRNHLRHSYPTHHRSHTVRNRTLTLTSIQEE